MTAKEMLEQARSYTELTSTAYYFNGDELMQFVSQLCKEQRDECAEKFFDEAYNALGVKKITRVLFLKSIWQENISDCK